jgi:hypothetical protein
MGLHEFYDGLAKTSQNTYELLTTRNPLKYYLSYAYYLAFAQGPKLSYANNFEPEYTKKTVKFNAPIVLGMFAATWMMAELVRNKKKRE